jgi:hypothetical protein
MLNSAIRVVTVLMVLSASAEAAAIRFNSDPFDGSTALATPGRQVVGGEPFIDFSIGTDTFEFFLPAFAPYGFGPEINFANGEVGDLPTGGVNVIVLRTFDNDNDSATPFGAGNAANLIAAQLTSPGAGFFIYFNSGLNLPRLVFSTDLDDPTADLKIMARMTDLGGAAGQLALADFTEANFAVVPEPTAILLLTSAGVVIAVRRARRHRDTGR